MIHQCSYCNYKSNHKWVVTRHMNNIHKAPTNTLLQPKVAYSSTENRQHLTGYQIPKQGIPINGSGVLHTTQQYDPRAKPQIQNNELKHEGNGPQTSVSYSVNPVTNEDPDTETVSEARFTL